MQVDQGVALVEEARGEGDSKLHRGQRHASPAHGIAGVVGGDLLPTSIVVTALMQLVKELYARSFPLLCAKARLLDLKEPRAPEE